MDSSHLQRIQIAFLQHIKTSTAAYSAFPPYMDESASSASFLKPLQLWSIYGWPIEEVDHAAEMLYHLSVVLVQFHSTNLSIGIVI